MKRTIYSLFLLAALVVAVGCSKERGNPRKMDAETNASDTTTSGMQSSLQGIDRSFVLQAAQSGQDEVDHAKVMESAAKHPDVKQFAQKLDQDHSAANQELQQIAQKKNVDISAATTSAANTEAAATTSPSTTPSVKMTDKEYVSKEVADHLKAIDLFERQVSNGTDEDLKTFAQKILPTLRQHLEQAKSLNEKIKT